MYRILTWLNNLFGLEPNSAVVFVPQDIRLDNTTSLGRAETAKLQANVRTEREFVRSFRAKPLTWISMHVGNEEELLELPGGVAEGIMPRRYSLKLGMVTFPAAYLTNRRTGKTCAGNNNGAHSTSQIDLGAQPLSPDALVLESKLAAEEHPPGRTLFRKAERTPCGWVAPVDSVSFAPLLPDQQACDVRKLQSLR